MKILVNFTERPDIEVFAILPNKVRCVLRFVKEVKKRGSEYTGTAARKVYEYDNRLWIDPKIAKTKGGGILYDLQLAQFTDVRISDIMDYVGGIEW